MKKINKVWLVIFAVLIANLFVISVNAAEISYEYSQDKQSDWRIISSNEKHQFMDTGIGSNDGVYDTRLYSILDTFSADDNLEYTVTLENGAKDSSNAMLLYFNWRDSENTYFLRLGGSPDANPVELCKVVDGVSTSLDVYEHYSIHYSPAEFNVKCSGGNITVTAQKGESEITNLFDIEDNTFIGGKVGVGFEATRGFFTGISVKGSTESSLKISSQSPENNAVNVAVDTAPAIVFDSVLDTATVNKTNVYVLQNNERLSENAYELLAEDNKLTVAFAQLKENTAYTIVITTRLLNTNGDSLKDEYSLSFETYKGDGYLTYEYNQSNLSDWKISDSSKFAANENGISSTTYDAKFSALLHTYIFKDEFTYTASVNNGAAGASNEAYMYFNYQDANNNLCLTIGGSRTNEYPITLSQTAGGNKTELGSAVIGNGKQLTIKFKNGKVEVLVDGQEQISADTTGLSSGCVGVGVGATLGKFTGIKIEGYAENVRLRMVDGNISNGQENVLTDISPEFTFNYALKPGTVNKANVKVLENSAEMAESSYDVKLGNDNKTITIVFANALPEKTEYSIVLSENIVSEQYSIGLADGDRTISFKTKEPLYDVRSAELKSNGETVSDISEYGGKDVKFNISVKNNDNAPKSFAVSVMLVQNTGEVIAARYYQENIAPGNTFEKNDESTDNTLRIPKSVTAGAKMVYFVWDSFSNMRTLYPSGEF